MNARRNTRIYVVISDRHVNRFVEKVQDRLVKMLRTLGFWPLFEI